MKSRGGPALLLIGVATFFLHGCRSLAEQFDCDGEGIANGVRVSTYPNGVIKEKADVADCRCSGTTTTYRPDGSKIASGSCKEGQNVGEFSQFNQAGAVIGSQSWAGGNLVKASAFGARGQLDFYPASLVVVDTTTHDSLPLPQSAVDNQYTWFFEPLAADLFLLTSGRNAFVINDSLDLLFDLKALEADAVPKELDIIQGSVKDGVLEIKGFVPLDTSLKVIRIPLP